MKYGLALVGGLLGGMIVGGIFTASSTCCTVVAQGIRDLAPASVQSLGDALNIWPALVGLAQFGNLTETT